MFNYTESIDINLTMNECYYLFKKKEFVTNEFFTIEDSIKKIP